MIVTLERLAYFPDATFGRLILPKGGPLWTVECPWHGNMIGKSCIPEGLYPLVPGRYNRGGYDTWEIPDGEVPGGRTLIKVHAANLASELAGCIAPGLGRGEIKGQWAVTSSRDAHQRFMDALEGAQDVKLRIIQYRPMERAAGGCCRPLLP